MYKAMSIENRRFEMQVSLDSQKTHLSRNEMGQFSTPFPLALDIMRYMKRLCPKRNVSFLEPAFGTGVFLSAFISAYGHEPLRTLGFEIDPHYCVPTKHLWSETGAEIHCADFLRQKPKELFDMLVTNPPYTRHHHIDATTKIHLQENVRLETGIKISGLAGLYCHFLMLSTKWLKPNGVSCWLIPCEFMDVNYGVAVRRYLSQNVEIVRIHRFRAEDLQFADALVSSCVVVFKNKKPDSGHRVVFSTGGSVMEPIASNLVSVDSLDPNAKWTQYFTCQPQKSVGGKRIGDYFTVKRGIATGDNSFFILDEQSAVELGIPRRFLSPILPSPRYIKSDRIVSEEGVPTLDRKYFLFTCDLDKETLRNDFPSVWRYICTGEERGVNNGYLCSRRTPWYSCEKRDAAPIVVPYMGRGSVDGRLFRFILNESDAVSTNVYLMLYPKKQFAAALRNKLVLNAVWRSLNAIPSESLVSSGRTYGGGLHKLEPRELMNAPAGEGMAVMSVGTAQLS